MSDTLDIPAPSWTSVQPSAAPVPLHAPPPRNHALLGMQQPSMPPPALSATPRRAPAARDFPAEVALEPEADGRPHDA